MSKPPFVNKGSLGDGLPETHDPSVTSLVDLAHGKSHVSQSFLSQSPDQEQNDESDYVHTSKMQESERKSDLTETPVMYRRRSVIRLDMTPTKKNTEMEAPARFIHESTYRQTIVFILALACYRCFPERQLVIQSIFSFRLTSRSYYCRFVDSSCKESDIAKLKNEMKKLIEMAIPIKEKWMLYEDCIQHFTETKQLYSAKLAKTLNRSRYLVVGCFVDGKPYYSLSYRHLLANTKVKNENPFGLYLADHNEDQNDFILAFPSSNDDKIAEPKAALSIHRLYKQGVKLGKILGVECVGDLNALIQSGKTTELILLSEAYHDMQIVNMAKDILTKHEKTDGKLKMILISGPSSSGKTTFASKLCIQLKLLGLNPVSMEVDMFYKDRRDPTHPKDDKGELNFEVIEAVRIDYLQKCLRELFNGNTIKIPNFSFVDGQIHSDGEDLKLPEKNGILVMEGIFCLNPKLTSKFDDDTKFKVFMCPISFFSLDNHHFLSEQIIRLVRRVSRDHRRRNKTAKSVLFKWGQLQGGEDENIFPYVDACDQVFNSLLPYEIPVLKVFSKPLIQTIMPNESQYKDAQNLLAFLHSFVTMPDAGIPTTSLIQEFMGNSVYDAL